MAENSDKNTTRRGIAFFTAALIVTVVLVVLLFPLIPPAVPWLVSVFPTLADFPARSDIQAYYSWLGDLVSKFVPWAAVLILVLALPSARRSFLQFFERCSGVLGEIGKRIASGDGLKMGVFEFAENQARKNPQNARIAYNAQIQVMEEKLDEQIYDLLQKYNVDNRCEELMKNCIEPMLDNEKLEAERKSPRFTLHMIDPLYKNSILQVTEYFPRAVFGQQKPKVGRRFSSRYGIAGRAVRKREDQYDPNVSTSPSDLIDTWGMTASEAQKAGLGRKSHLALLIPKNTAHFILFFDAPPQNVFTMSEHGVSDVFNKIRIVLRELGLERDLEIIFDATKTRRLLDDAHGPESEPI